MLYYHALLAIHIRTKIQLQLVPSVEPSEMLGFLPELSHTGIQQAHLAYRAGRPQLRCMAQLVEQSPALLACLDH